MKKFRILGILAILVIAVDFIISVPAGWKDANESFMEGFNSGSAANPLKDYRSISVRMTPLETAHFDSLPNNLTKENIPYKIDQIRVPFVTPMWSNAIMFFGFFAALAVLAGFYCLIRLLISISRRNIFTDINVRRMRMFTYSVVGFTLLNSLVEWFDYLEVTKQISFPGYEIVNFNMSDNWMSLIIIVLFTEIFAVGVKIKEEQDLTI